MNQFGAGGLVNSQPDVYLPRTEGPDYRFKTAGILSDENGDALNIDANTRSLITVDYAHHEMHEGSHYFIKTWVEITGATGSLVEFIFITPDVTKQIHAKVELIADADSTFTIYEGATVSSNGSAVTAINCYRDSTNTALLQPYANPTVTSTGSAIWTARNGGGRTAVGVGLGSNFEIIAKRNSIYLFRLIKNTTADTIIDIDFFWYEHEPKW